MLTRKSMYRKNKDSLTPAALNKREMKKVKAAPWLNFFGSLFFLLAVGSVVTSFVLHMTLSPLVFVAADVLFVILVAMLPVSAKRKEVCKNPDDYEDMLYISLTGLGFGLHWLLFSVQSSGSRKTGEILSFSFANFWHIVSKTKRKVEK